MPDISIQFYATPEELLSFVRESMTDHNLHAVTMRFRPFEAREVGLADLNSYFSNSSDYYRWAFTVDAPNLPVEHELDHGDKNPDHLRLEVGKFDLSSLWESWLSCRTNNKAVYDIWKKVALKLRKQTLAGVTGVNRQNGMRVFYKSGRYTNGAKLLEEAGVSMIPPQGPNGPKILLGDATARI